MVGCSSTPRPLKQSAVVLKDTVFHVEVAETQDQQTKGLKGRVLLQNQGMLFPDMFPRFSGVTMKGCKQALDFVFLKKSDSAFTVVAIVPNNQPCKEDAKDCPPVPAPPGADSLLELPSGLAEFSGVQVSSIVGYGG